MTGRVRQDVVVIGVGNPDRADDGVGLLVAQRLTSLPGACVLLRRADACGLLADWAGAAAVVLVDAARCLSRPGAIHRLDLAADPLDQALRLSSTHALGVMEAISLAQAVDDLPARMIVYAIEGACFELGAAITPAVLAAVPEVARLIAEEVRSLQAGAWRIRCRWA